MNRNRSILITCAAFALAIMSTSSALAQLYIAKQDTNTRYFQIAYENPPEGDDEIRAGMQAWNSATSRLSFPELVDSYGYPIFWDGPRVYNARHTQIFFWTTAEMETGATGEIAWGQSVGSFPNPDGVPPNPLPVMYDADIIINRDRIAQRIFDCNASTVTSEQIDVRRVIAHEAGHVAGLDDLYTTSGYNCIMYGNSRKGIAGVSFCDADKTGVVRLYGAR